MIITIVFAVLSVLVIVFTSIYLNKNKDRLHQKSKIKKEKNNIKNLWEIDEIVDNVILSENKKTIIMKIGSIDYHLLSEKEQAGLEMNLIEISKIIKNPIQFFSSTEFVDTSKIIDEINQHLEKTDNRKIIEYGNEIQKYLYKLMDNRNLYVRKNYVLISTYGDLSKARTELIQCYETLRFSLLNAGITLDILSDIEIIELLHRELNKNSTVRVGDLLKEGGAEPYVKGKNKGKRFKER